MLITGTNHFPTLKAARRYYADYGCDHLAVAEKVKLTRDHDRRATPQDWRAADLGRQPYPLCRGDAMKFLSEDSGNWRVYYTAPAAFGGRPLVYCWQYEGRSGSKFYRCSRDGEPSHEVKHPEQPVCPFTDDGHYTPAGIALVGGPV